MRIQSIKNMIFAAILLTAGLLTGQMSMAQDNATIDIAEFHQILQSIDEADIPENVKDQLYRDMKASMIENVRLSNIPEDVKRTLIKDLQSTTRK